MRRALTSLGIAFLLAAVSSTAAFAGNGHGRGPASGEIWAGNQLYATVATPTDLTGTGAPDSSFEPIYAFSTQANVALAAPGEAGFKGGRWQVLPVTWNVAPYLITNGPDVLAAAEAGDLTIASTPVKEFECPLILIH
jgi:hypothetical protein